MVMFHSNVFVTAIVGSNSLYEEITYASRIYERELAETSFS